MTNHRTIQPHARKVIVGVDTHKHVHVAVAIDTWGIRLGDRSCAADSDGYQQLITWAERHGRVAAFGIEGTGSYGAGLARAVRRAGHQVLEVNRGDRRTRRIAGKSDTVDAETAARSVLAGQSTAIPKTADGAVEMMRHLKVARRTAVKARTSAMITLKPIVVTAPPELRETLHPLADQALLKRCRGWRCGTIDTPTASAKHTLRALARRWCALSVEIVDHDRHLGRLTTQTSPTLREGFGIGADTAAEMLIIFGDNPDPDSFGSRLRQALRGLPHPGVVRDDDGPPPPLPRRASTGLTRRSTGPSSCGCGTTHQPSTTSNDAPLKGGPNGRSSAVSNAFSPARFFSA